MKLDEILLNEAITDTFRSSKRLNQLDALENAFKAVEKPLASKDFKEVAVFIRKVINKLSNYRPKKKMGYDPKKRLSADLATIKTKLDKLQKTTLFNQLDKLEKKRGIFKRGFSVDSFVSQMKTQVQNGKKAVSRRNDTDAWEAGVDLAIVMLNFVDGIRDRKRDIKRGR